MGIGKCHHVQYLTAPAADKNRQTSHQKSQFHFIFFQRLLWLLRLKAFVHEI